MQVGFNKELLCSNQILEEILIFLEKNVHHDIAQQVTAVLYPLPVIFYTARANYRFRDSPPDDDKLWNIWVAHRYISMPDNSPPLRSCSSRGWK
jgi:hypothetical protein